MTPAIRFLAALVRDIYTVNAEDKRAALLMARMSGHGLARGWGRMPRMFACYRAASAWVMTIAIAVQVWAIMCGDAP